VVSAFYGARVTTLGIEKRLKAASKEDTPFHQRYELFKHRLFNNEYEHWAAGFPR